MIYPELSRAWEEGTSVPPFKRATREYAPKASKNRTPLTQQSGFPPKKIITVVGERAMRLFFVTWFIMTRCLGVKSECARTKGLVD